MDAEELTALRSRYFGEYDGPQGPVRIYKPTLAHPDPVQLTADLEALFAHVEQLAAEHAALNAGYDAVVDAINSARDVGRKIRPYSEEFDNALVHAINVARAQDTLARLRAERDALREAAQAVLDQEVSVWEGPAVDPGYGHCPLCHVRMRRTDAHPAHTSTCPIGMIRALLTSTADHPD